LCEAAEKLGARIVSQTGVSLDEIFLARTGQRRDVVSAIKENT
jgi:hypothetical protein